jgi:H+-transporting ATPase
MAPTIGDLESGRSKEFNALSNNEEELGEYGDLVRYISITRTRRASTVSGVDDVGTPKKKHFWQKKSAGPGGDGFDTPDEWLTTDMKQGLQSLEVENRRKKTGWNELTTEKENLFLKFLGFFTGPILYGLFLSSVYLAAVN